MLKRAHALSAVVAQICTRAVFIRIYLITDGISGQRQRVTWGHNISCRGIPPPFIPLPTSHLLTKTKMQVRHHKCALSHFSTPSSWNDWQTNGWMDRQTDKASYRVACRHVISNRDTIGKWRKWLNVSCLGVKVFCLFTLYLFFIHSPWVVYCISIRGMSVRLSACPLIRVAQLSSLTNTHIRWNKDLSSLPYLAHLI